MSAKRKYNKNSSAKDLYNLSKRLGVMGGTWVIIFVLLYGLGHMLWDKLQTTETSEISEPIASNSLLDSDNNSAGMETVYICTGHSATRYHRTKSCSGLGNCNASIEEVSKSEAENKGRTQCGKCYN